MNIERQRQKAVALTNNSINAIHVLDHIPEFWSLLAWYPPTLHMIVRELIQFKRIGKQYPIPD